MHPKGQYKLLFEYYDPDEILDSYICISPDRKIRKLLELGVKTVHIFSSGPVEHETFIKLVNKYKEFFIKVNLTYMDNFSLNSIKDITLSINEISSSFKKGGYLIISYGKSYALHVLCCYFISRGKSASEALKSIKNLSDEIINDDQMMVIKQYEKYLKKGIMKNEIAHEKNQDKVIIESIEITGTSNNIRHISLKNGPEIISLETPDLKQARDSSHIDQGDQLEEIDLE